MPQKRPALRPLRKLAGMCKNPQVDTDRPAVAELMADVAAAVGRRAAAVSEDVYEMITREIPQLGDDKPLLALLASSSALRCCGPRPRRPLFPSPPWATINEKAMATVVAWPSAMAADVGGCRASLARSEDDAVGGVEEHLLEQARQITTPDQGRRGGQGRSVDPGADQVGRVGRRVWFRRSGPVPEAMIHVGPASGGHACLLIGQPDVTAGPWARHRASRTRSRAAVVPRAQPRRAEGFVDAAGRRPWHHFRVSLSLSRVG